MTDINQDKKFSKLFDIFNLSSDISEKLNDQILNLKLEPGQKLNDFNEEIPGIFFIEDGEIRLLGLNNKKETFTIEKFSKNQIVGAEQILAGLKGQSIAASSSVKGSLISKNDFLNLVKERNDILEIFSFLSLNELFCATILNEDSKEIDHNELLFWSKEQLKNKSKIYSVNDGEEINADTSKLFLVSSSNVNGFPPGSIIKSKNILKIQGTLPGRLIPLKNHWFAKKGVKKENFRKKINNFDYINFDKNEFNKKKDALEDKFGRLNKDILYDLKR